MGADVVGEDEHRLRTPFEVSRLRTRRFARPLTAEQRELAQRAAFSLRVGLEEGEK
jgi:hypothetical protein